MSEAPKTIAFKAEDIAVEMLSSCIKLSDSTSSEVQLIVLPSVKFMYAEAGRRYQLNCECLTRSANVPRRQCCHGDRLAASATGNGRSSNIVFQPSHEGPDFWFE